MGADHATYRPPLRPQRPLLQPGRLWWASSAAAPETLGADVTQLSFGSATPGPLGLTADETLVRIINLSSAMIEEAGIRRFGSTDPYQGSIQGTNPATFGGNGGKGSPWISLPVGTYEGFLKTDHGIIEFAGSIPAVQLPDGSYTAGPADLYLFEFDLPNPNPGGGGTVGGGGGGGVLPGGGGGILP